jgi:hypothetical protein
MNPTSPARTVLERARHLGHPSLGPMSGPVAGNIRVPWPTTTG